METIIIVSVVHDTKGNGHTHFGSLSLVAHEPYPNPFVLYWSVPRTPGSFQLHWRVRLQVNSSCACYRCLVGLLACRFVLL